MKFGKSYEEAQAEAETTGTSGGYIRYFKEGDTTFRILQEPQDWVSYWEHYNPGGFPFPCTGDRQSCPGCISNNEKMKKASRKIAIQVLEGDYVNVYKFPKTLADKLSNRADRIGTVCDRDYTITKFKSKNSDGSDKVDYDLEGGDKVEIDKSALEMHDVEVMLKAAYDESWGDSDKAKVTEQKAEDAEKQQALSDRVKMAEKEQPEEPPFDTGEPAPQQKSYSYKELIEMPFEELLIVCAKEGQDVPEALVESEDNQKVVDWILSQ